MIPDEEGGARAAVGALLEAGHTRIGFINNTDDVPATRQRLQAFRATLTEAGLDGDAAPVESEVSEVQGAMRRPAGSWHARTGPPACSATTTGWPWAPTAPRRSWGSPSPADLSVVGFDDQELIAANLHPGLTTVALPHYEMGAWATEHLIDAVEGKTDFTLMALHPTILDCPLVARDSVAAPPP